MHFGDQNERKGFDLQTSSTKNWTQASSRLL